MESKDSEKGIITPPLFDSIREYFLKRDDENQIHYLFVPYIKTRVLEQLLEGIRGKVAIITTWRPMDLLAGSSELDLYLLCKKLGMVLYLNNRIHLKIYSSNFEDMILATANISNRGLGTIPEFNFECATYIQNIKNSDRRYFAQILKESIHVDDTIYDKIVKWYEQQEKIQIEKGEFDDIIPIKQKDQFLISSLPMTKSVQILEESYEKLSKQITIDNIEIRNCVFHDLANYSIKLGLSNEEFKQKLKEEFFNQPFIQKIDEFIQPEAFFGRIKEWIQNNCTDVPVPSRRELTENIQVLLEWFEKLGDGKYVIDIPGKYSQRIRKVKL